MRTRTIAARRRFVFLPLAILLLGGVSGAQQNGDWPAYGRDAGGERFSPLDDIRRDNVGSLQVAWTFRTGDAYQPPGGRATAFEATPLLVDGTLLLSTPLGRVLALDPVTGQQKWVFDAKVPRDMGYGDFVSRGVSTWQRGSQRRIIVATVDARLIALDAATGQPIPSFGDNGTVDLRQGLAHTADRIRRLRGDVAAGDRRRHPRRRIRDCRRHVEASPERRGARLRRCHRALEVDLGSDSAGSNAVGADTWKNNSASRTGSANAWSVIVGDPEHNLVFVPTSSPSHDYFGGERLGDNLFADSLVALRADTGDARLALPDRASRSLGLRRRVAADSLRLAQGRTRGRGGGRRLQDRTSVHPRSGDRRTAAAGRGAAGAEE